MCLISLKSWLLNVYLFFSINVLFLVSSRERFLQISLFFFSDFFGFYLTLSVTFNFHNEWTRNLPEYWNAYS
jgi:hypothetical protein